MKTVKAARKATGDLLFLYFSYLSRYAYTLILVPFYARTLGPTEYGTVLTALSLFTIVSLITEWGFPDDAMRTFGRATASERRQILYIHLAARVLVVPLAICVGIIGTYLSPVLAVSAKYGYAATLLGILNGFHIAWYFIGTGQNRMAALLEFAGYLIALPMLLLLIKGPDDGFYIIVVMLTSGLISTVILPYGIAFYQLRFTSGNAAFRVSASTNLISITTPLALARALPLLSIQAIPLFLSLSLTARQIASFAIAEKICALLLSLQYPVLQIFSPKISYMLSAANAKVSLVATLRSVRTVTVGVGIFLSILTFTQAERIIHTVFGVDYGSSAPALRIMSIGLTFAALSKLSSALVLIPNLRYSAVLRFGVITLFLTLCLVAPLTNNFGVSGAAAARTMVEITMSYILCRFITRDSKLSRMYNGK